MNVVFVKSEPMDEEPVPLGVATPCSPPAMSCRYGIPSPIMEGDGGVDDNFNCTKRSFSDRDFAKRPKTQSSIGEVSCFANSSPSENRALAIVPIASKAVSSVPCNTSMCKQFWKAGDYEGINPSDSTSSSYGMDHVRVHPKFLHSNATSHKWALGAIAELLDNSLDEICNGATFVNVDVIENMKDGSKMLLVEDNGGGMDPDLMRQCMSLGYSAKSKLSNTIGQYGNGFKTSTMRLGADVIVFSRSQGKNGSCSTQSIGLLSYTFLRNTGKEDIVVPIIDYEEESNVWTNLIRHSSHEWSMNLETILMWSPYASEDELLQQFEAIEHQGTRVVIYNLWEDDEGNLELDFCSDNMDIQLRGVNRDPQKIAMAEKYPNSRHFLTFRHSLRSYASILYLRLPSNFWITLRGKVIDHHSLVNDMMFTTEVTYKPQHIADGTLNDHMIAVVTLGFVKDAMAHIDIQGFNVYHKNRLIKPFWRVWNAAGSSGRGVIGVLEANFIEPAHDKQGFERTTVLSRLEARLIAMQKTYWSKNCDKIGYASAQRTKKPLPPISCIPQNPTPCSNGGITEIPSLNSGRNYLEPCSFNSDACQPSSLDPSFLRQTPTPDKFAGQQCSVDPSLLRRTSAPDRRASQQNTVDPTFLRQTPALSTSANLFYGTAASHRGEKEVLEPKFVPPLASHKMENGVVESRPAQPANTAKDLLYEREMRKMLEVKLREAKQKLLDQQRVIQTFSEEKKRRDEEEFTLRSKLEGATNVIYRLLAKVKELEKQMPVKTEM